MFGKLLKHELRSSAPLMLILSGIALIFGFMGAASLRIMAKTPDTIMNNPETGIWIMIAFMLLFYAAYIGIILYAAASQYIQLFRFYGSRFTDRGYLTFTLPISTHTNFLSAATNMLIWQSVVYCVTILAIIIMVVGGMADEFQIITTPTIEDFANTPWGLFAAMLFLLSVSPIYTVIANMTAVVTACSVFKRMKVLGCIGFIYALSMVSGFLFTAVMMLSVMPSAFAGNDPTPAMAISYIIMGVVMLLASVGGYFLSTYLMKKKLNLS